MKMKSLVGCIVLIVILAAASLSYLYGKFSPPAVVSIVKKPGGVAFSVREADSTKIVAIYYDYNFDGTLDLVSILKDDGERESIAEKSAPRDVWMFHIKRYLNARGYAAVQLE